MTPLPVRPSIVFKTPKKHVAGEVLLVLLTTPVILVTGLMMSGLCGYMGGSLVPEDFWIEPSVMALAISLPALACVCMLAWLWAKRRLKFTLCIAPQKLRFGRRPFRESLPCLAVETVLERAESIDSPASYRVQIIASGKRWTCFLGPQSRACVEALRAVCTNAIFVDLAGREHLPSQTHSPVKAIRNLVRGRARRAAVGMLVAMPCLLWGGIILALVVIQIRNGTSLSEATDGIPAGFLAVPLLGIVSLIDSITQFRKASRLSKRIRQQMRPGIEGLTTETATDLSSSGIEDI